MKDELTANIEKAYDYILAVTEKQGRWLDEAVICSAYQATIGKGQLDREAFSKLYAAMQEV